MQLIVYPSLKYIHLENFSGLGMLNLYSTLTIFNTAIPTTVYIYKDLSWTSGPLSSFRLGGCLEIIHPNLYWIFSFS